MASRKKQLSQGEWATVIKAQDQASKMLLKEEEDLLFENKLFSILLPNWLILLRSSS